MCMKYRRNFIWVLLTSTDPLCKSAAVAEPAKQVGR